MLRFRNFFGFEVFVHHKILEWAYAFLVLAIALLALIGVLLFAWHAEDATPWTRMTAAEWGVWVGSIGTIGALIGTIWLATAETRRRVRQEREAAQLHGTSIKVRLAFAAGSLAGIADLLERMIKVRKFNREILQICHTQLEQVQDITVADAIPLTALDNHAATFVVSAAAGVRGLHNISKVGLEHAQPTEFEKHMRTLLEQTRTVQRIVEAAHTSLG